MVIFRLEMDLNQQLSLKNQYTRKWWHALNVAATALSGGFTNKSTGKETGKMHLCALCYFGEQSGNSLTQKTLQDKYVFQLTLFYSPAMYAEVPNNQVGPNKHVG